MKKNNFDFLFFGSMWKLTLVFPLVKTSIEPVIPTPKINQSNVRNYHSMNHLNKFERKKKTQTIIMFKQPFYIYKKTHHFQNKCKKISNLTFPSKDFMHSKLHPQIIVHV